MSTIKHPVGPQSSKVYWRRRLVVGLGLLIVLALLILVISSIVRPAAGTGVPDSTPAPAAEAAGAEVSASDPAADPAACDPASVQIEATTDAVSYEPGAQPMLSLSVTNIGDVPCVLNAGTATQVFTVSSGTDVYWTSTDCQQEPGDADVSLQPGEPVSSDEAIAWDRTRSNPDTCGEASRDAAPAGGAAYNLTVSVDGIESVNPKQFFLS
ncbi:hypothetical protein [Cryobacterium sp. Sr3]|uniref:hypothetical protein n=1 Tax=Cryobacterium sp. Sr3 TaxID=1259194 RepID=UPI00106CAEDE|nr:hypothetical protein [Cryobacterium sp. Sr3]TFB59131.1 hypothetical protein E3N94_03775 [Cryobacterium sp. Sr3]